MMAMGKNFHFLLNFQDSDTETLKICMALDPVEKDQLDDIFSRNKLGL